MVVMYLSGPGRTTSKIGLVGDATLSHVHYYIGLLRGNPVIIILTHNSGEYLW